MHLAGTLGANLRNIIPRSIVFYCECHSWWCSKYIQPWKENSCLRRARISAMANRDEIMAEIRHVEIHTNPCLQS